MLGPCTSSHRHTIRVLHIWSRSLSHSAKILTMTPPPCLRASVPRVCVRILSTIIKSDAEETPVACFDEMLVFAVYLAPRRYREHNPYHLHAHRRKYSLAFHSNWCTCTHESNATAAQRRAQGNRSRRIPSRRVECAGATACV